MSRGLPQRGTRGRHTRGRAARRAAPRSNFFCWLARQNAAFVLGLSNGVTRFDGKIKKGKRLNRRVGLGKWAKMTVGPGV